MSNAHYLVIVENWDSFSSDHQSLVASWMRDFPIVGIEEYSANEKSVNSFLGERSYSGGDLPKDVMNEVDENYSKMKSNLKIYFEDKSTVTKFIECIKTQIQNEVKLEKIEFRDWNEEWKKHFTPIEIDSNLIIRPSWEIDSYQHDLTSLFINPGMGFGTGHHETTYLCLKVFGELLFDKLHSVLDFGSGSGILGLAVLKKSPQSKVDFYDIDPEAHNNAKFNLSLNKLVIENSKFYLPEDRHLLKSNYDLIFANILQNILYEEAENLYGMLKMDGILIVSGLLASQVEETCEFYKKTGFKILKQVFKNDWGAIILQKGNQ